MKVFAFLTVAIFLAITGVVQASNSEKTVVSKKDSGGEINVPQGSIIQIELQEIGGTGYLWQFDDLDREYFDLIKIETENTHKKGFTGGPILKKWQLRTKKTGETSVYMYYFRPWEGREKAADRFFLTVCIK